MTFIGQSTRRLEDQRFLTGRGLFVDDVNDAGQAWAYVVRSPHAHATIDRIDTSAATGALGIYTYHDIADLGLLPCATQVASVAPMVVPPRPALAHGRARFVGDPVAFVVAETVVAARDAAEQIVVDYTPLPCVVDAAAATVIPGGRKSVNAALSVAATVLALPNVMVSVLLAPL